MRGYKLIDCGEFIYCLLRSVNHDRAAISSPSKVAAAESFSPVSGN